MVLLNVFRVHLRVPPAGRNPGQIPAESSLDSKKPGQAARAFLESSPIVQAAGL